MAIDITFRSYAGRKPKGMLYVISVRIYGIESLPWYSSSPKVSPTGNALRTARDALQKIARDMRECWGTRRLMVDLCRIDPRLRINGITHPLAYLARTARANQVSMVPVTGLQRDTAYKLL